MTCIESESSRVPSIVRLGIFAGRLTLLLVKTFCFYVHTYHLSFYTYLVQEGWLSPTERVSVSAHFGLP